MVKHVVSARHQYMGSVWMRNIFRTKARTISVVIAVALLAITLGIILDEKLIPDWVKSVSVESADSESVVPATNDVKDAPVSIPPMGGSNLEKEINDIRQKGDLMIERADALVAKYRTKDTALPNSTTKQRIDDVKARLDSQILNNNSR